MRAVGTCVSCTAGKHDECDSPGSPGEVRCPCCPDATEHSPARRLASALRDDSNNTNEQGGGPMTTAKKAAAPTKATAKKAAARPNVKAAVPPQGDGIVDAPPPEKPEADPKPAKVMFTECPDCGYKFSKPQPTACRVKAACDKRKSDPDYRVKGATPKPTSDKPSQPGTRKASTISAMNTERQLEKDWKAGGEQGERPATPLLDKIRAEFEAKEAKKAAAKAERDTAKVTPITKNSEAAAS